jgi:hypothetical protein
MRYLQNLPRFLTVSLALVFLLSAALPAMASGPGEGVMEIQMPGGGIDMSGGEPEVTPLPVPQTTFGESLILYVKTILAFLF